MKLRGYCLLALAMCMPMAAQAVKFTVDGVPAYRGKQIDIAGAPRLLDALSVLNIPQDTYFAGASLCRSAMQQRHQQIKQSLLRDVLRMRERLGAFGQYSRREQVIALGNQIERLPVSGCKRMPLDFATVAARPLWNLLLQDGDVLYYPPRPRTVVIGGAVARERLVPYAGHSVAHYLTALKRTSIADTETVWVVQADGSIDSAPVAYWNRDFHPVTPGAVIVVPVAADLVDAINPEFNRYLAELYAAQKVLP